MRDCSSIVWFWGNLLRPKYSNLILKYVNRYWPREMVLLKEKEWAPINSARAKRKYKQNNYQEKQHHIGSLKEYEEWH